jgi:DNA-binding transcriptional LysR family regulator
MGMLLGSTLKGIGFARLPAFACEEYLNNGRLLRILHDYDSTPDVAIYAIYPDKKFLPMKVRKFIDLLTRSIGS